MYAPKWGVEIVIIHKREFSGGPLTFNNITPFPSLFAENLIIRGIEQGDLDVVLHYFQKNRAYLTPWEPLKTENFFSREGWEKRLIPLLELQRHGLSYYFLIFEQGSEDVVGVISYNNILQYPFHSSQVGYSLAQNRSEEHTSELQSQR